jgi:hypothetical protein
MQPLILIFKTLLLSAGIWTGGNSFYVRDKDDSLSFQKFPDGTILVLSHNCDLPTCCKCEQTYFYGVSVEVHGGSASFYSAIGTKLATVHSGGIDVHVKLQKAD